MAGEERCRYDVLKAPFACICREPPRLTVARHQRHQIPLPLERCFHLVTRRSALRGLNAAKPHNPCAFQLAAFAARRDTRRRVQIDTTFTFCKTHFFTLHNRKMCVNRLLVRFRQPQSPPSAESALPCCTHCSLARSRTAHTSQVDPLAIMLLQQGPNGSAMDA